MGEEGGRGGGSGGGGKEVRRGRKRGERRAGLVEVSRGCDWEGTCTCLHTYVLHTILVNSKAICRHDSVM